MQEAEELYELREALEGFAVEKAMEKLDTGGLDRLRKKMDVYGRDIQKRFTRERLIYDQNIHLEIAEIAANETLKKTLRQVFERIIFKRKTDALYDPTRGVIAHQEHMRLLEAMQRRNIQEAVTIVRKHIQQGKKNVLADLRQRKEIRDFHVIESETYHK
jgi:DNA-binding GntR family transcriptional regulator